MLVYCKGNFFLHFGAIYKIISFAIIRFKLTFDEEQPQNMLVVNCCYTVTQ